MKTIIFFTEILGIILTSIGIGLSIFLGYKTYFVKSLGAKTVSEVAYVYTLDSTTFMGHENAINVKRTKKTNPVAVKILETVEEMQAYSNESYNCYNL
jgi:hypothetical protein